VRGAGVSTASRYRTAAPSNADNVPRVKPISRMPLSTTHSSEMATICSVRASGALGKRIHSAVMPSLRALFSAVRMSWNLRPVKARPSSGSTVSSATCNAPQPSAVPWARTASVTE
jgi:hypothetical protein